MGGIRLQGDVRALMRKMGKLQELDKRGANKVLAQVLRTSTIQRFKNEEDPEGKSWKPSLRAQEDNAKTLSKTGLLRRSIKTTADDTGFAVGTNKIYGATHQYGDDDRRIRARNAKGLRFKVGGRWVTKKQVTVSIPARPYLGVSEEDMAEIKGTMEDLLAGDEE